MAVPAAHAAASDPLPETDARTPQLQALLAHFESRGVELRPAAPGPEGSYIQHRYTIGPAHGKQHVIGLSYLPPLTREAVRERNALYSIPHALHGDWALFAMGGPGGNATPAYRADWERALAALRAYPAADPPASPAAR